jgi:tetratricopeptide (TPR) repeat protein
MKILFKHLALRITLLISITLIGLQAVSSQSNYEKGWKSLNEANVKDAISYFESAVKSQKDREKAQLCLTLLYSQNRNPEKGSEIFLDYFDKAEDPYPACYSMWYEDGVAGLAGKKEKYQLDLLEKISKDPRNAGKLDASILYKLSTHYLFSSNRLKSEEYAKSLNVIEDWLLLGPFDNVMNGGFNKDYGIVENVDVNQKYTGRYDSEIEWFDPPLLSETGYFVKEMYFIATNAIIYNQTFLEVPYDKEVILKLGYSGSLKLWVNDSLIYEQFEKRSTEMDYYRFKCKLNQGYNRVLIQLGDYDESFPSLAFRITDSINNPITLPQSNQPKPYKKGLSYVVNIPYFATNYFEEEIKISSDPLNQILLAKCYIRSKEFSKAEHLLNSLFEKHPKNYFVLRNMILLYDKANDATNQNKFYEIFEKHYPKDSDIMINKIEDLIDKKDKVAFNELKTEYLALYPDKYQELYYELSSASLDAKVDKILLLVDSFYNAYPNDYKAVATKYQIEKEYYAKPDEANEILKKYFSNNYNYDVLIEIGKNYLEAGKIDEAIEILKWNVEIVKYSMDSYKQIINLLTRQLKYDEAIELTKLIIENRPSDYTSLEDLAVLTTIKDENNKQEALDYYKKSLQHFPFSYETNEEVRELKGLKRAIDLIAPIDPVKKIKDYEDNFKAEIKKPYDIVYLSKSLVIFNTKATATRENYILKINDESAIESWQKMSFSSTSQMDVYIDEAKTIKKNGDKILAERNKGDVVFTNLEVGDYLYVSYTEKQVNGGKSSVFISDNYTLNSYYPVCEVEYNVLVEDGLNLNYKILNDDIEPKIKKQDNFKIYNWKKTSPKPIKDEPFSMPLDDIAPIVHVSLNSSWNEIVKWYNDLSFHQAASDYTIKTLAKELFNGKEYSEDEKFKIIYDFVITKIQYSSIDFRQSGHIPQKASKVYHTRLGDCKDLSTLFVSLAREVGLKANLVLINTSNNGEQNVILPSLNFNHCIVKAYIGDQEKFLELTDPYLPFGYLNNYHEGASILEIHPIANNENINLEKLKLNKNHLNKIYRNGVVDILAIDTINITKSVIRTGLRAAAYCQTYIDLDDKEKRETIRRAIADDFKSTVTLKTLQFEVLEKLQDTAKYNYSYMVDNEILKMGSFKSLKIPFGDNPVNTISFSDEKREHLFDFMNYEKTHYYQEDLIVNLANNFSFIEIPQNILLEYKGSKYALEFQKLEDKKLKIKRSYAVNRQQINAEDFTDFKKFMMSIKDAENTHLLFK